MNATEEDKEIVRNINDFYVGSLSDEEMESFLRCEKDNLAKRVYEGTGGFLGLSKIQYMGD